MDMINTSEDASQENEEGVPRSQDDTQYKDERFTDFPFGIVFLHGLNGNRSELSYIEKGIHSKYGDQVIYIQPISREEWRSIIYSASSQLKGIVKEIKHKLTQHGKESKLFPLIILGYSDGGKLAFKLLKDYRSELNIIGINTINGALNGAHILTSSPADVQTFISKGKDGLELLNCPRPLSSVQRNMNLLSSGLTMIRPRFVPAPVFGIKDMLPGSASIKDVSHFIHSGAGGIPCFLIATHQNDFGELFNIKAPEHEEAIGHFNDAYSKFITGTEGEKHDTLLSIRTQLGRGDSLENITGIESPVMYVQPTHSNITGHIYHGLTHAGNLVPIDDSLFFPDNVESVVTSEVIREDVIKFIGKTLQEFWKKNLEQRVKCDNIEETPAVGKCNIM